MFFLNNCRIETNLQLMIKQYKKAQKKHKNIGKLKKAKKIEKKLKKYQNS